MQKPVESLIYRTLDPQNDGVAFVRLLNEVEQADATGEQVTETTLREQLTWSGQDPTLNNWVVALPESASLVGYGLIQKTPNDPNADLHIVVHPAWRCQGIGTQLFTHLLARTNEFDERALRAYVPVQNTEASLFLGTHGFEAVSTFTRLSVTGIQPFPAPLLPLGFTTRRYEQIEQYEVRYMRKGNRTSIH
jgi:ribosomal protein S18 acetylase RimI-like enzyme